VKGWFSSGRANGIGILCGLVSRNLVCRDFDVMSSYESWMQKHPELAKILPTVKTPRGRHLYFRAEDDKITTLGDGELRGNGYVLAPPSMPAEIPYEWIIPLPHGELQLIDPVACGLTEGVIERTERIERIDENREIEAIVKECNVSNLSIEIQKRILEFIKQTLPNFEGNRNKAIFEFARALKSIPTLVDVDLQTLQPLVKEWHKFALPVIGTKPFDDTWGDFLYGWERVKYPRGSNPLKHVLSIADNSPLPSFAKEYECPTTIRLIKFCRELQSHAGETPFFLSAQKAAELLDTNPMTVWRRFKMLESEKVLLVTTKGNRTRATRYRYIGNKSIMENSDGKHYKTR
jgi:hypothetical protein